MTPSTIVHERRNLLAPINRLPLDVLFLIPTHLTSLRDRLRVTFVCRHWRRTFLQYAALWNKLYLTRRTDGLLTRTLIERAKGIPLDITVDYSMPPNQEDVALLPPFAQQIRSLEIKNTNPDHIGLLTLYISGPLPSLHTIQISTWRYQHDSYFWAAPTLGFFRGAMNLKNFHLYTGGYPSLQHFTFPNLTTLNFSTYAWRFPVSRLLDFLEASPALRQIRLQITTKVLCEDVPPERLIVLSHVKTFFLDVSFVAFGYETIATHISCPFANHVELTRVLTHSIILEDIYPPSIPWNIIARQYTEGMVERVVVEMTMDEHHLVDCSINFRSSERTTLKLSYTHHFKNKGHKAHAMNLKRWIPGVLSRALRTIQDHPLLANVRHLHIKGGNLVDDLEPATEGVGRLLGSMGPLGDLTLEGCDLRPYLDAFLDIPLFAELIQPASFPPIKELAIIRPIQLFRDEEEYAAAIVELARSQDARGMPFERMRFCTGLPSPLMDELAVFVGTISDEDEC